MIKTPCSFALMGEKNALICFWTDGADIRGHTGTTDGLMILSPQKLFLNQ